MSAIVPAAWAVGGACFLAAALIHRVVRKELGETTALLHQQVATVETLHKLLGPADIETMARHATVEMRRQLIVTEMDPDHGDDQEHIYGYGWARCRDCQGQPLEEWAKICEARQCILEKDAVAAIRIEELTGDRPIL